MFMVEDISIFRELKGGEAKTLFRWGEPVQKISRQWWDSPSDVPPSTVDKTGRFEMGSRNFLLNHQLYGGKQICIK